MDNCFYHSRLVLWIYQSGIHTPREQSDQSGLDFQIHSRIQKNEQQLPQGNILWNTHTSRKITMVTWIDIKPIMLVSTRAHQIEKLGKEITMPHLIEREWVKIKTSPVHSKYATYTQGSLCQGSTPRSILLSSAVPQVLAPHFT